MTRALGWIALLAALIGAAVWLAEHPGQVALQWFGYRIETSLALVLLALVIVVWLLVGLFRFLFGLARAPRRLRHLRVERRRRSGYMALTRGMVAVAAGDVEEATHQARRADALLDDPPITMLLSAQASQLAGDETAAEKFFRAMIERKETEFLGIRGLLTQAIRRGDAEQAMQLAARAQRIEPGSEWVAESLFDMQIRNRQWAETEATLNRAMRRNAMPADKGRRRLAVLLHQRALEDEAAGNRAQALKRAGKAVGLQQGFLPAIIQKARLQAVEGKLTKAAATVREAWARQPHPALLDVWWAASQATDALGRARAAETLVGVNPEHPESHIAAAEAALEAQLWGEARRHLEPLAANRPDARVCRMMAALEESQRGDLKAAHDWLLRASLAEPDPAWVCDECGHASAVWSALCPHCDSFDSLRWRAPPRVQRLDGGEPVPAIFHAVPEVKERSDVAT